jgi:hypothetical protein
MCSDKPQKVAGFLKQVSILTWKNSILIRRKKLSTILEIVLSLLFISMLLTIRYFVEKVPIPDQFNPIYNVMDYFQVFTGKNLILYYPNNPLIQRIIMNAYDFIRTRKPWLNATSMN